MSDSPYSGLPAATSFSPSQLWGVDDADGISRKLTGAQVAASWGLDYLGSTKLSAAAHETSNLTLTYPPGSGVAATRDFLWIFVRIVSYGGSPDPLGDIGSLRFNGDSGANYWSLHATFLSGAWSDFPQANASLIRLASTPSRLSRNVMATVNNFATRGKTVNIKNQTGTADPNTVGVMNLGGGEWVNLVDQISSVQLVDAGSNNMGSGSGFIVLGKNF